MSNKAIAIGVAAVLVIAAVGGIVFLTQSNNDDKGASVSLEGRWNIIYYERVRLVDNEMKPILNADDCEIRNYVINPNIVERVLDIKVSGEHVITGKHNDKDISGTFMGPKFSYRYYTEGDHKHVYMATGILKPEGYISEVITEYGYVTEGTETRIQVCSIGYAQLIPEGKDAVSHMEDYVDYHMFNSGDHLSSVKHAITDFEGGGNGEGTEVPLQLEFVRTNTLITLFSVLNNGVPSGVQALASLGAGASGMALGNIAGNVQGKDGGTECFVGFSAMSNNMALFMIHPRSVGMGAPHYFEVKYNVMYPQGSSIAPLFLGKYNGECTIWSSEDDSKSGEAEFDFRMYDNTLYCKTTINNTEVVWFGEVYGQFLDITVISKNIAGRLQGYVDGDGAIHLFGKLTSDKGIMYYIDYDLTPTKG